MIKKKAFDRKRKVKEPFGWSQVTKVSSSGSEYFEWGCPFVHKNSYTNKYERCSYSCRKDRTKNPHYHEFKIPPENDDMLEDKYKTINQR